MKKINKIFLLGVFSTLALTGCGNIFEGGDSGSGGNAEPFVYTADDIKYYTEANQTIFTQNNKTFYKSFDGYCAVALANIGGAFDPVLVGEDAAQVQFSTNKDSQNFAAGGFVEVGGKNYYYSSASSFVSGKLDSYKKYDNYVSTYTTLEEVARDLASKAIFVPVDESKKNVFVFEELDTGTYQVSAGPYVSVVENLVIPAKFNNVDVSSIKSKGFEGFDILKSLTFESGSKIKKINSSAFNKCTNLRYVVIPAGIQTVGESAFYNCSNLTIYCGSASKPSGFNSYWKSSSTTVCWSGHWYTDSDGVPHANKFWLNMKKTKGYLPKPINTSSVSLPNDLGDLVEKLAENVHENWAKKRIEEGWKYGEKIDSILKITPCLVPYYELPESEKEYDRKTALETIKLLLELGYIIEKGH